MTTSKKARLAAQDTTGPRGRINATFTTADTKALNINIPADLHHWLRRRAAEEDTTMTDLVLRAVGTTWPEAPTH
ncbi:hypothetical protein V6721_04860 [Cutibacterium acnes]|uniref:hypothetical protein n=1 Tax=Cutibacterium acnes TaxID=1747 RepID=UPI0021B83466|nr:hypothetical protein [Cutibacterium acnes]